jgi:hypothetical protein
MTEAELLNNILNMLYTLEDKTEYEIKEIGEAINLLQKLL